MNWKKRTAGWLLILASTGPVLAQNMMVGRIPCPVEWYSAEVRVPSVLEFTRFGAEPGDSKGFSEARPVQSGLTIASLSFAQPVFDVIDGTRVRPADRTYTDLSWFSVTHGFSERFDLGLVVPVYRIDHPAVPGLDDGLDTGVGDSFLRGRYLLSERGTESKLNDSKTRQMSRAVGWSLSALGELRLPIGDQNRLLGTQHWSERVGLEGDLFGGSLRRVIPNLSVWATERAGHAGYGFSGGAELLAGDGLLLGVGATGDYYEQPDPPDDQYVDGYLRVRMKLSFNKGKHPREVSIMLRYQRPLNEAGIRSRNVLFTSLSYTFGTRSKT